MALIASAISSFSLKHLLSRWRHPHAFVLGLGLFQSRGNLLISVGFGVEELWRLRLSAIVRSR
ncbi:MAG TPA: hypothetical protein VN699_06510 [Pirellulales bacterium]|nr:hypothetical protein [Pirellulales bacterium]